MPDSLPPPAGESPWAALERHFLDAAAILGLEPGLVELLSRPERVFRIALPVELPGGSLRVYRGWRVQHDQSLGPFLGGLRLDPDVTEEGLRALAAWNTWRCAALAVPFGGSVGAIDVDPRTLPAGVLERLVRRWTAGVLDLLGPERDVVTPDFRADVQVMAWILDTYSMHARHTVNAVVVGKPTSLGGSFGQEKAVGWGVLAILDELAAAGEAPAHCRVAVAGAGLAGGPLARVLTEAGHRVVALGDRSGGVAAETGLDVAAALAWRREQGGLAGCPAGDALGVDEVLSVPADVLVVAGSPGQLDRQRARAVRAAMVLEVASGGLTGPGEEALLAAGRTVVPDLLANGGAVVAAWLEWVQGRIGYRWHEKRLRERLQRIIREAWEEARRRARAHDATLRLAACLAGVERVASLHRQRGLYA